MKLKNLILNHLYHHGISFQFQDYVFNPSLEVERKDFVKLMTLLKKEISFFFLLDISALEDNEETGPLLVYHLLHMEIHQRLRIKVRCLTDKKMPSIAHLWANALWYEKELFDFFGVCVGNNNSRLILPMNFVGHPLQKKSSPFKQTDPFIENEFQTQIQGGIKKYLALGSFNSMEFPENGYAENRFYLEGTTIVEGKFILGFEHQGIEKFCEGKSYVEILPLLEKINVQQAPLFTQLWCSLLEAIFGLEVPDRSQALRMLTSEMVRIQDHLKTFSIMTRLLGGYGYSSLLSSLCEKIYALIHLMCPKRDFFRFSCPGGMLEDIPLWWRNECSSTLCLLEKELASWEKVMLNSVTLKERLLRDHVSGKEALEWGFSGPVLRACGINYDLRKTEPYYFYNQVDFEIPLGLNGSAYDRFLVRLEEIKQSVRIIYQLLDNLPMGENLSKKVQHLVKGENIFSAWTDFFRKQAPLEKDIYFAQEGPSGEVGYYLNVDENNLVNRLKVHTSSFHHAQAFEKLIVGLDVDDFPLIQGSLNFSIGEVER